MYDYACIYRMLYSYKLLHLTNHETNVCLFLLCFLWNISLTIKVTQIAVYMFIQVCHYLVQVITIIVLSECKYIVNYV